MRPRGRIAHQRHEAVPLKIYARHYLVDAGLAEDQPALLLEGAWPSPDAWSGGERPGRTSLDGTIDARYGWIDDEASALAHRLAEEDATNLGPPSLAYLNELKLRYYLVKLLRITTWFEHVYCGDRGDRGDAIDVALCRNRDEDYAEVFQALCRSRGMRLSLTWRDDDGASPAATAQSAPNPLWRRWAGRIDPARNTSSGPSDRHAPTVFLVGDRRVLDPVCEGLLGRGARVAWIYDRFAVKTCLRWRRHGVRQLLCHTDEGTRSDRGGALGLPVVDNEKLVGMVTETDFLKVLAES